MNFSKYLALIVTLCALGCGGNITKQSSSTPRDLTREKVANLLQAMDDALVVSGGESAGELGRIIDRLAHGLSGGEYRRQYHQRPLKHGEHGFLNLGLHG